MRFSSSTNHSHCKALICAILMGTSFLVFASDGRSAPMRATENAVAVAPAESTAQVAPTIFADWLRDLLGSRRRLLQVSLVFVVIALFVIWWR